MTDYRRMTKKDLMEAAEGGDDGAQAELDRRKERKAQKRQGEARSNPIQHYRVKWKSAPSTPAAQALIARNAWTTNYATADDLRHTMQMAGFVGADIEMGRF